MHTTQSHAGSPGPAGDLLLATVVRLRLALAERARAAGAGDRGDVPGWVLITVMTAALVGVIYGFAKGQIDSLVQSALQGVK